MTDRYTIIDPYADANDDTDLTRYLADQGWEEFFSIGGDDTYLQIRSWRNADQTGPFLARVEDVSHLSPFIQVATFVDLMDLFARWAPAIQAAAVSDVVNELRGMDLSEVGVIERAAARVVHGVQEVLPQMRGEAEQRRRQAAERVRRGRGSGQ